MKKTKTCKQCGVEFVLEDKRMVFCSETCRERNKTERRKSRILNERGDIHAPKDPSMICNKEECRFYVSVGNHCDILNEVHKDDLFCSFFKEK